MSSYSPVMANSTSAVWFFFVSKHPEAVLLLTAQWSILLYFNELLFCRAAMLAPLLRCAALSRPGHTWEPLMWKLQGFSLLIMQQLALINRVIGPAGPQDPSTAALLNSHFSSLLLPYSIDFEYCLSCSVRLNLPALREGIQLSPSPVVLLGGHGSLGKYEWVNSFGVCSQPLLEKRCFDR